MIANLPLLFVVAKEISGVMEGASSLPGRDLGVSETVGTIDSERKENIGFRYL